MNIIDWDAWMAQHHIKLKGNGDPNENARHEESSGKSVQRPEVETRS